MRPASLLLVPVAALLLAACAGAPATTPPTAQPVQPSQPTATAAGEPTTPAGPAPFSTLAARFIDRAIRLERAGELPRALAAWRVVSALRPGAEEPKRRVSDLAARLDSEAERRYQDGLARLTSGDTGGARREFLLALAANPDHAAALDAVKNRLETDSMPYTVAAGDTFAEIAKKQYGDPAKSVLVARANDLDPAGHPSPGTVLMLPSLAPLLTKAAPTTKRPTTAEERPEESAYDTEPSAISPEVPPTAAPPPPPALKPADQAEEQLAKAAELLRARKYEEAAAAADKLAGSTAVGARAREVSGNAWFAIGDAASREERFADAIAAYRRAEPTRKKDATAAIAAVERRRKEKAEEYYSAGVRYFIDQQLNEAIRSWEQTLALNPEHPTAPRDLEKARKLKRQLEEIR